MGTVFQIPWTYLGSENEEWPRTSVRFLQKLGFKTAAMALNDNSIPIDDPRLKAEEKLAVILGTEGDGLASSTIADCDYTVRIPMSHGVDSLNVAAASAVAFWELGRYKNTRKSNLITRRLTKTTIRFPSFLMVVLIHHSKFNLIPLFIYSSSNILLNVFSISIIRLTTKALPIINLRFLIGISTISPSTKQYFV